MLQISKVTNFSGWIRMDAKSTPNRIGIMVWLIFLGYLSTISLVHGQINTRDSISIDVEMRTFTFADTLQLDFYGLKDGMDATRPLLVLVHGGGFSIGKRNNPLERGFCEELASLGFAVASIDYRLTRKGKGFGCDCPSEDKMDTFLSASEDLLLALQFLHDNQVNLKFDPNHIVLMGSSAGAEVVLNTVFMRHHHEFKKLPYGALKFAGIISFAGAVLDATYITEASVVPTLMFHGQKDNLVPFAIAPHHHCEPNTPGYLMLEGPQAIAGRMEELNAPYILYYSIEGKHNWANVPYKDVKLISSFIDDLILEDGFQQSKIRISE